MEKIGGYHLTTKNDTLKTSNKFGVPCSKLKDYLEGDETPCTNEAEAMAMAAGAWFAGKEPEVYMQNSGLGHIVDIVASLYKPYEIPLPELHVSIRKSPEHHKYMYEYTEKILDMMEYKNVIWHNK